MYLHQNLRIRRNKCIQMTNECLNKAPIPGNLSSVDLLSLFNQTFLPYSLILAGLFSQYISFCSSS